MEHSRPGHAFPRRRGTAARALAAWAPLAAILLAGCMAPREPSTGSPLPLTETRWLLSELDGQAVAASPAERMPELSFAAEDARITGFTGCNHLSGSYTLDGDRLRFSEFATTQRACLDTAVDQLEQRFVNTLQRIDRFGVSGGVLILYHEDEAVARFTAGDS